MAGEIGKVIKRLREKARLRQADLSTACNVKQPNLSRIEKGRCEPRHATLVRIAEALGTTAEVIEADAGRLAFGNWPSGRTPGSGAAGESGTGTVTVTVPVLEVGGGRPPEIGPSGLPVGPVDMSVELPPSGSPCFACRVRGDAMTSQGRDSFADGDLAVFALRPPRSGDFALVQARDGVSFRQAFFEAQGMRLVPLNRAYEEKLLSLPEVVGAWKLVQHLRVLE